MAKGPVQLPNAERKERLAVLFSFLELGKCYWRILNYKMWSDETPVRKDHCYSCLGKVRESQKQMQVMYHFGDCRCNVGLLMLEWVWRENSGDDFRADVEGLHGQVLGTNWIVNMRGIKQDICTPSSLDWQQCSFDKKCEKSTWEGWKRRYVWW